MITSACLRKMTLLVLGLFFCLTVAPSLAITGQEEDVFSRARRLINNGELESAIKLLEDYIAKIKVIAEQKKNVAEAYYIIAKTYYMAGEDEKSDANLKLVFETYPSYSVAETNVGFLARIERIRAGVAKALAGKKTVAEPIEKRPANALLQLSSSPGGASVLVNDQEKGVTPGQWEVPAGTYEIKIELKNYQPKTESVTLSPLEKYNKNYVLEPAPNMLQQSDIQLIRQLVKRGDLNGASQRLKDSILRADQKNDVADLYYRIAKSYYSGGNEKRSAENLRLVFETYPDYEIAELNEVFKWRAIRMKALVINELERRKKSGIEAVL
jgi:tetratricopeptide (TPR) repeat protein